MIHTFEDGEINAMKIKQTKLQAKWLAALLALFLYPVIGSAEPTWLFEGDDLANIEADKLKDCKPRDAGDEYRLNAFKWATDDSELVHGRTFQLGAKAGGDWVDAEVGFTSDALVQIFFLGPTDADGAKTELYVRGSGLLDAENSFTDVKNKYAGRKKMLLSSDFACVGVAAVEGSGARTHNLQALEEMMDNFLSVEFYLDKKRDQDAVLGDWLGP